MKKSFTCFFKIIVSLALAPTFCAAASSSPSSAVKSLFMDNRIYSVNLSQNYKATIAHSEFDPSQGSGEVVSNVNVFSGMPYYQIPLMGLNARGVLSWNFVLTYNGSSVAPQLNSAKIRSSSGPLGLGWSMVTPYVSVNHMGTATSMDDVLYCNLGPYGGGQILQNEHGNFFVSTNPYIKVKPVYDTSIPVYEAPRIVSWEFTMQDGYKMFFGETFNSQRTLKSRGNVVGAHPASAAGAKDLIYQYDLSRFSNFDESTNIQFEYSHVYEAVAPNVYYVRESALSSVYWQSYGVTVDSIALIYADKHPTEYPGYQTGDAKDQQRVYETRFLSQMQSFARGSEKEELTFSYNFVPSEVEFSSYNRNLLGIKDSVVSGESRNWQFFYDETNHLLTSIVLPNKAVESYEYKDIDLSKYADTHAPSPTEVMKDENGNPIALSDKDLDEYVNSASCTEKFCFAQLTVPSGKKKNLYVQVYQNNGNYYGDSKTFVLLNAENPIVRFASNYFILADVEGETLDFYEWNGFDFVNKDNDVGSIFTNSSLFEGEIENVFVEENYALIVEEDDDDRYIHSVVKDQTSGKWTVISFKSDTKCTFANIYDYGDKIRSEKSDYCLEWDDEIMVQTSPSMFIVSHKDEKVVNVFSFNGSSFEELSQNKHLFPYIGIQKTDGDDFYSTNFKMGIANMTLSGNTLILDFQKDKTEYVCFFYFDGNTFQLLLKDPFKMKKDYGPGYFYVQSDYVVGVLPSISNVVYWHKFLQGDGSVTYARESDVVFPFDGEKNTVYVSGAIDAFYLEELKPSGRPVVKDGRYHNVLMGVPWEFPWVLVDHTSELGLYDHEYKFSPSDPIVYFDELTYSGGLCDKDGVTCTIGAYSRGKNYYGTSVFRSAKFVEYNFNLMGKWMDKNRVVSNADRMMMISIVEQTTKQNLIALGQYSGENFTAPKEVTVVESFKRFHGLESFGVASLYTEFDYGNPNNPVKPAQAEFNVHTQQPQFKNVTVKTYSTGNALPLSETKYEFVVDLKNAPLTGIAINTQGSVKKQENYDASGALRSSITYKYDVYRADDKFWTNEEKWPDGLYVNFLDSTHSIQTDNNGNAMSSYTKNVMMDPISGQFFGVVSKNGDKYAFTQNVLETQTVTRNGESYKFTNPIWNINYVPFDTDPMPEVQKVESSVALKNLSILRIPVFRDSVAFASKVEYFADKPHLTKADSSWRPMNEHHGAFYDVYREYTVENAVVSVNGFGQVTESMSRNVNGMRSSCTVYEGLRSLPTITFPGAACSDVAGTTAEEGDLNGWEMAQTELDGVQVYDGLYSFRVTDGFGPTRNIKLKEIKKYKYDFVISGFAYSTGTYPILMAEFRRGKDNSIARAKFSVLPVSGKFEAKKWQRYELEIPYDTLIADGMFDNPDDDDYLRIWFGFGEPQNNPSRVMFVDDFVAYPTSSTFALKNYDTMGLPISSMSANFERQEIVYDKNHRPRSTRDSKGRIFTDNAKHLMNENVR